MVQGRLAMGNVLTTRPNEVVLMDEDMFRRWIAKVDLPDDPTACWVWNGTRVQTGYGKLRVGDRRSGYRTQLAHRLSYRYFRGPLGGMDLHHACRNRACVHPEHLVLLTRLEHSRHPHRVLRDA